MIPERLATIRANDADGMETFARQHRRELLAYVDELKHDLSGAGQCIDAYVTANARSHAEAEKLTARATEQQKEIEYLHGRVHELEAERHSARQILQRVTARMEDYSKHGSGHVNVRQVLNLLSPTWPDGNYAAVAPDGAGNADGGS